MMHQVFSCHSRSAVVFRVSPGKPEKRKKNYMNIQILKTTFNPLDKVYNESAKQEETTKEINNSKLSRKERDSMTVL